MTSILKYSAIVFYALSFILVLRSAHQLSDQDQVKHKGLMLILWLSACVLHAIHLYPQTFTSQGINLNFYNSISIVLFIISSIVLILSFVKRSEFLGLFILPLVIVSIALTILKPEVSASASNLRGLQTHIVSSLFAFSVLSISAIQSLVLFNQDRHLRDLSLGGISHSLPPLHDSEKFLFQTITVGFVLLTIALLSGFIFLENMFEQHIAHKTILSILAWIIFSILLWGRWQFGWRGRKAIRWTLGGFALLILAYLGSKFVQELILNRVDSIAIT